MNFELIPKNPMTASWDLEGSIITFSKGSHIRAKGVVLNSRVKYGGSIQHTVQVIDDNPLIDSGIVLIDNSCIHQEQE